MQLTKKYLNDSFSFLHSLFFIFYSFLRPGSVLIFFFLSSISYSQENDAGLWTSVTVEKKISQSLSVNFSEAFRLDENIGELGTVFSELGIEKKIVKGLSVSAYYRFAQKRELSDDYSQRHRYYADVSYRKKISDLAISFRSRYQVQLEDYFLPSEKYYGNAPENYLRNKISIKHNSSKKYKPFLSAEIWSPLWKGADYFIDNLRFAAGFEYEINKRSSLDIYYIFQREINRRNPRTDYISALSYTFAF